MQYLNHSDVKVDIIWYNPSFRDHTVLGSNLRTAIAARYTHRHRHILSFRFRPWHDLVHHFSTVLPFVRDWVCSVRPLLFLFIVFTFDFLLPTCTSSNGWYKNNLVYSLQTIFYRTLLLFPMLPPTQTVHGCTRSSDVNPVFCLSLVFIANLVRKLLSACAVHPLLT